MINLTLWIAQGLLAILFGMAGLMKSTQPVSKLASTVTWATRFPVIIVLLIGLSELLGALGLILPGLLDILPILTPIAAAGLALIQLLAIVHHSRHGEGKAIIFNLVLLALALFVSWGRFEA